MTTSPVMPSLSASTSSELPAHQPQPKRSAGNRIRNQALRLPKRRPNPGKRYQCSGDGCRLACRSMKELLDHIQVHYRPTQSLEGKTFRCSSLGCAETFPDMQSLMGHAKTHYKLNRFFKCENCLSRFRTHRSLFKHLHSCSDRSAANLVPPALAAEKPALLPTPSPEKDLLGKPLEEPPKLQGLVHAKKEADLPGTPETVPATDSFPVDVAGPLEMAPLAGPAPHSYPLLEQSLFGPPPALVRFSTPPSSAIQGPFLPYMQNPNYNLPQAMGQNRFRPFLPGQGLPVSNAVWKKNQGHSSNSRIVWEHTRGRYNCLQCPYATASREEMTQHTEDHRKNPSSPPGRLEGEIIDFGVALPAFLPKLTPDVEKPISPPP